ncbi:MAG TPA: DM13 domain-containing protein [Mycobacteriales bacterium]|nr:DM13 domain-containing protein [Mycobacteriales bacterium]
MTKRRVVVLVLVPVLAVGAAVGLALFQPWKLWVDETVSEAAPTFEAAAAPSPAASGSPAPTSAAPAAPVLLASGSFVSHEHRTTGSARVLGLPGGRRVLRIEDLDTSNGPDLKVWLTDAPVRAGRDGWFVFDDGRYVDLGRLKGNRGSQNYELPDTVDLRELSGLSIWCDRFNVSFGAVQLKVT